jgi:hypothetical protein
MGLIKCQCGQTVLSVATQCPRCFADVKSADLVGRTDLAECRKCKRPILQRAKTCPSCGAARPAVRTRGLAVFAMVLLVLACIATLAFLWKPANARAPQPELVSIVTNRPPKPAPSVPLRTISGPLRVKPADSSRPRPDSVVNSDIARAREALAAASHAPTPETRTARPAALVRQVAAADSASTELRWVVGWANVRGSPSGDSQVVQVLRPGQQVAVIPERKGWWVVLENGRQVGYVARQLLAERPD